MNTCISFINRHLFVFIIFTVSCLAANRVCAQNIVTIFGQEKIEKTDEGQIVYRFEKGLVLPGGVNRGTLFNAQDMVAWLIATDKFKTPQAGDTVHYSYPEMATLQSRPAALQSRPAAPQSRPAQTQDRPAAGTTRGAERATLPPWKWAETEADTSGVFRNPALRSAYLYTAFDSPREQLLLLETTGATRVYVNGLPREGDHYDFGYTLLPVKLKKGRNEFIYTPGRFGTVAAKLVMPDKPVMFTGRDMTVPDLIVGETDAKWAAIRVINTTEKTLKGMSIRATLPGGQTVTEITADVMPLTVRKLKYRIPGMNGGEEGNVTAALELIDRSGKVIDTTAVTLRSVSPSVHHERTFLSSIDGSVQYYSVVPAIRDTPSETKAMVLTVHGAGVEARSQARAYQPKEWTDIVAATNRRPYGFNWEDWGRIDALEVLEDARRIYQPDQSKIYLTGHSMGGHGTWVIGTAYPDKFAAIAPCAAYPDISEYGRRPDDMHSGHPSYQAIERSANAGRTLTLIQNLMQSGVYIFHGSEDRVVPTEQARRMRQTLGTFHPDFCYYEYPGGAHWFGATSVDWPPIFDYFKLHTIPAPKDVAKVEFHTATPSVSASDYWVRIVQQAKPFQFSNVTATQGRDTVFLLAADNVSILELDIPSLEMQSETAVIVADNQTLIVPSRQKALLEAVRGKWLVKESLNCKRKYAERNGGFKQAFDNHVVFVYATHGSRDENEWYCNKARFDAETFYYRGNGSIDVVPDTEYSLSKYAGRNVVVYGNRNNNSAWPLLLKDCPIQVADNEIKIDNKTCFGSDLGAYYIYPHPADDRAQIGVVAGTGPAGMRALSPNNYISGITGFPDIMVFRADILRDGLQAMELAGFFDNDWTLNGKDF